MRKIYGRAGAGQVAMAALAALVIAGCSSFGGPERDADTGELTEAGTIGVFELRVGDCLAELPDGNGIATINAVPCSQPHTDEIFASVPMPAAEFPGRAEVETFAGEACEREFAGFVGLGSQASTLEYGFLSPTESSWADGDREVLCVVLDPAGDVTGSLEGAAR